MPCEGEGDPVEGWEWVAQAVDGDAAVVLADVGGDAGERGRKPSADFVADGAEERREGAAEFVLTGEEIGDASSVDRTQPFQVPMLTAECVQIRPPREP
jgi:hypothetical protein